MKIDKLLRINKITRRKIIDQLLWNRTSKIVLAKKVKNQEINKILGNQSKSTTILREMIPKWIGIKAEILVTKTRKASIFTPARTGHTRSNYQVFTTRMTLPHTETTVVKIHFWTPWSCKTTLTHELNLAAKRKPNPWIWIRRRTTIRWQWVKTLRTHL